MMISNAPNVRIPMLPSSDGSGVGLKEKRLNVFSWLAFDDSATQYGDKNLIVLDMVEFGHVTSWHNNHGNDPGSDTLALADSAEFMVEFLRPLSNTINLTDHVHVSLDGLHPVVSDYDMTANESIVSGQPVYVSGNNTANLANASSLSTANVIGFAITTANASESVIVRTEGEITLVDWTAIIGVAALTPGEIYYLDLTAGMMSTSAPTTVGQVVARLGIAITTTKFDIEVNEVAIL